MPHVERDGVKIFYESFGQGTPVVFLHPLSLNRYAWVHQVFAFARTHRVVIVDHRGHGLSDKPAGGFSIREMARDARAVLDHAEIDKAILVGTSAGSMVAVQTALDAPERVLAMMLVSCATRLAPRSWRGAPSVRRAIRGCLRLHDSGIHLGDNQAREARSC